MAAQPNVGALHGNLLTALGTAIVSGVYPPGQVITLDSVSAEHKMSRSVAREAIRVLESMGMIESRRGRQASLAEASCLLYPLVGAVRTERRCDADRRLRAARRRFGAGAAWPGDGGRHQSRAALRGRHGA